MNDDRQKFEAAMAFLTSRVSSGRCIRDPLADLHEALVPFHGKATGNPDPFARMDAAYAALSEKPAESGLWRPEEGKCGRTRDGRKVGPMIWSHYLQGWESFLGMGVWNEYGEFFSGKRERKVDLDLVSEWPESDEEPPIEVRECAWYMRRDGKIKGPAEARPWAIGSPYPWDINGRTYANDGSYYIGEENKRDLIREVPEPEASE